MNKINNILTNFLPVLVYIFPATFILGNLATNIFILLISSSVYFIIQQRVIFME